MAGRIGAVFDCMVFVQAAVRHGGPARACFEAARGGDVRLFVGREELFELRDVLGRPELRNRFSRLSDERVERFVEEILACAVWVETVPAAYRHPLDSKDAP